MRKHCPEIIVESLYFRQIFTKKVMPCWLDQTFSIKYLNFYYRELGFEIKLQGTVFDADYENAIFEKILHTRAA